MVRREVLEGSEGSSASFWGSEAFTATGFWGGFLRRLLRGGVGVFSCSVVGGGSAGDALLLRVTRLSDGTCREGFVPVLGGIFGCTGFIVLFFVDVFL
jgi:hypothetical protein